MELHHHDIAKCSRFTHVLRTKSNVKPLKFPFQRLPKNIPDSNKTTYKPHNYQQCNIIFDSLKPQNRQPMYDGEKTTAIIEKARKWHCDEQSLIILNKRIPNESNNNQQSNVIFNSLKIQNGTK